MKYYIRYYECYDKVYEIEAESREEASEKLLNSIWEGREKGPDNAYDSGCEVID